MKTQISILFFLAAGQLVLGSPKKYQPDQAGDFDPSTRYYESKLPSDSYRPQNYSKLTDRRDKESKFGILPLGYTGPGGSGYGGNGNVAFSVNPMKIDLAGVAIGALIGFGAVLIIPKLTNALMGGHYRTLDNDISSSVPELLARIDNSLEQHNIDSSSCMQRMICSYINDAKKNKANGEATSVDEFFLGFTNNKMLLNILDGTAVKQAIEMGKAGNLEECTSLYPKCPITKENVLKVVASFLPS